MDDNTTAKIIVSAIVGSVILFGALGTYIYVQDRLYKKKIGGKLIRVDYRYSKEFDD